MKPSLTLTISMDDIKASVDDRFYTNKTDIEYSTRLNFDTDKALSALFEQITTQVLAFANAQWNLPEDAE